MADDASRMTLAELIIDRKGRYTYQDLEDRSRSLDPTSEGVSKARWNEYVTKGVLPEPKKTPVIASTLGVTGAAVWMAFGRTVGIDIGESQAPLITRLPPDVTLLDADDEEVVLALLHRLIHLRRLVSDQPGAAVRPLRRVARARTGNEDRGSVDELHRLVPIGLAV